MRFTARRDGAGDAPFLEPPFTDREEAESRARWETAKRRQAERTALGGTDLATLGVLAAALTGLGQAERAAWLASDEEAPQAPSWDQVATEADDALARLTLSWRPPAETLLAKEPDGTGAAVLGPFWSTLGSGGAEGEDRPRPAPAEGLTIAATPAPVEPPAPAAATRADATEAALPAAAPVAVPQAPDAVPIRVAEDASGSAPSTGPIPENPAATPPVASVEDGMGPPAPVATAAFGEPASAGADAPRAGPSGPVVAMPAAMPDGPADAPGPFFAQTKPAAVSAAEADRDAPPGLAVAAASPGRADPPGPPDEVRDAPPGLAVTAAAPGRARSEAVPGDDRDSAPGIAVAAVTPGRDDKSGAPASVGEADPPGLAIGFAADHKEEPASRPTDTAPADVAVAPPDAAAADTGWEAVVVARLAAAPADDLPPGLARLAEAAVDPGPAEHAVLPDNAVAHGARADAIL